MHNKSKEAQKKLILQAADSATDFVDAGMHPTDAVIKSAQQYGLSPGAGEIVAKSFNISRTAMQRDADDVMEKAAEFDLADPEMVRDRLNVDGAVRVKQAHVVDDVYSRPPTELQNVYKQQKLAESEGLKPVPLEPLPKWDDNRFLHDASNSRQLQRKIAEAQSIADDLTRQLDARLDKLANQFTVIGAPTIQQMNKIAELKGDDRVLAITSELVRRKPVLEKRAGTRVVLTDADNKHYQDIVECSKLASDVIKANESYQVISRTAGTQILKTAQQYINTDVKPFNDFLDTDQAIEKVAASPLGSLAMLGAMSGLSRAGNQPNEKSDNVQYYMSALDDPGHSRQLQAIKARTIIESLMANDPVLSGYHPDDVVDAYNTISSLAPRASDQQAYLQSMMRKYLTQGNVLAPDDIKSNAFDANKSLLDGIGSAEEKPQHIPTYNPAATKLDRASKAIGTFAGGAFSDLKDV